MDRLNAARKESGTREKNHRLFAFFSQQKQQTKFFFPWVPNFLLFAGRGFSVNGLCGGESDRIGEGFLVLTLSRDKWWIMFFATRLFVVEEDMWMQVNDWTFSVTSSYLNVR